MFFARRVDAHTHDLSTCLHIIIEVPFSKSPSSRTARHGIIAELKSITLWRRPKTATRGAHARLAPGRRRRLVGRSRTIARARLWLTTLNIYTPCHHKKRTYTKRSSHIDNWRRHGTSVREKYFICIYIESARIGCSRFLEETPYLLWCPQPKTNEIMIQRNTKKCYTLFVLIISRPASNRRRQYWA